MMSAKARDGQGRWRCQTIGIRVSPQENAEINALVALTGKTKQEYCIDRMLQREIVVMGNPRVHKALKNQMEQMCEAFVSLCNANEVVPETLHVLEMVCRIFEGLGNDAREVKNRG